jgi:hypothetical protein
MRIDNPDGFMWSCCEEGLDSPGCVTGAHKQPLKKAAAAAAAGTKRSFESSAASDSRKRAKSVPGSHDLNLAESEVADKRKGPKSLSSRTMCDNSSRWAAIDVGGCHGIKALVKYRRKAMTRERRHRLSCRGAQYDQCLEA